MKGVLPMSDSVRNAMYYGLTSCFDSLYENSKLNCEFTHLMDLVTNQENILLAFRNIKRNDGSTTPGVDGVTIDYLENLTVSQLVKIVRDKFVYYVPKPVKRVEIPKPYDPTKKRPLGIPCLIDRLCQQCLKQVLEPIAEAKFYENSFGFRANRSCEDAIAVATHHMNISKLHYVVDVDIHAFFDCVDHGCLMRQLWHMGIHDRKLLAIIRAMLKAPIVFPDRTVMRPDRGVPQGGILSPLLANIVLNDLDWWIANQWEKHDSIKNDRYSSKWVKARNSGLREVHVVRYADDFKLFCRYKKDAIVLLKETKEWLLENLRLETSPEKSGITNVHRKYTEFLGFELKLRSKKAELGPNASNYKRRWVCTSRIKPKAIPKIKAKLEEGIVKLAHVSEDHADKTVDEYNSIVDGIQQYYSMASQISDNLGHIQAGIRVQMHNRIKNLKFNRPAKFKELRKTDKDFLQSKQTGYLYGYMIHPIGVVHTRHPKMPNRKLCNYTQSGRAEKKVVTGVPANQLAWLARHTPPDMLVEVADNRISAYSAQKGNCAILGTHVDADMIVVLYKNPGKTIRIGRYQNLLLVSRIAGGIITDPDIKAVRVILDYLKPSKKVIHKVNQFRELRGLAAV